MPYILDSGAIAQAERMECAAYYEAVSFLRSNLGEYLDGDQALGVALERSVPHTVVLDAISIWSERDPYGKPDGATELPYGYWADLLLFPVRERNGKLEALFSKRWFFCAAIPLLTVERKVLGIIGEKHIVCYDELQERLLACLTDIQKELGMHKRYEFEELNIDRYSFICRILHGSDAQIKIIAGSSPYTVRLPEHRRERTEKQVSKGLDGMEQWAD